MKNILLCLVCIYSILNWSALTGQQAKVKNIILIIGDGMGLPQIQAAMNMTADTLNLEHFKYIGLSKTYSANDYITDSGAGGTAIASGKKTYNGAISVDIDSIPVKTILEYAEESGKSTGLVATCAITHATPASFIAHEKYRENHENIAYDFLSTEIDIFIGGGRKYFNQRSDKLNLLDSLKARNYMICEKLDEINVNTEKNIACLLDANHLPPRYYGRNDMLPKATKISLQKLNTNPQGFFVMIEGSQIDWGGHQNNLDYVVDELLDLDLAIGEALEFAKADGNTLIIVTADHETGGLTLIDGNLSEHSVVSSFSTEEHSGLMVPVFAFGPGSEEFIGMYENTEIFNKMMKLLIP